VYLRQGSFIAVSEDRRTGWLLCPKCNDSERVQNTSGVPPRGHLLYYALYSGSVIFDQNKGEVFSLPLVRFDVFIFWNKMRFVAVLIPLVFLGGALCGFINSWVHVGIGLGLTLTLACNRAAPPMVRYPASIVGIQILNFVIVVFNLSMAWWKHAW